MLSSFYFSIQSSGVGSIGLRRMSLMLIKKYSQDKKMHEIRHLCASRHGEMSQCACELFICLTKYSSIGQSRLIHHFLKHSSLRKVFIYFARYSPVFNANLMMRISASVDSKNLTCIVSG